MAAALAGFCVRAKVDLSDLNVREGNVLSERTHPFKRDWAILKLENCVDGWHAI